MIEKILLGVCASTGNAYAKKFIGKKSDYDKYVKENEDLTPIPEALKDKDLTGLAFVDGEFVIDPEKANEIKNQNARAERRREYPPVGDQLDAIMKWLATENEFGIPAELKSLAAKCMSVKSKYPLEE